MTLFLIILSIISFSLLTNFLPNKYDKLFVFISILIVFVFYFFLAKIFLKTDYFFPKATNYIYTTCGNYYNLLTDSIIESKLNIFDDVYIEKTGSNYKDLTKKYFFLMDTSVYKDKIYLYFGITPVLLFYLPFHLITNLYLYDNLLIFLLSCLSFIFYLLLINRILLSICKEFSIPSNIKILSIFLIGLCSLLPFIVIHSFIHQVAIITAHFLLIAAFYLLFQYINAKNAKNEYILVFFISLFLCLCVGARPHYIIFIPVIFFVIIYLKYKESKNINCIIKTFLIFLIPCLVYGTIIALYNYIRFDSIFEFGWKYQLNQHNQSQIAITLKDFFVGLKNNFFTIPDINSKTIFSLTKVSGHRIGNEYITGILWTCPIIFTLCFVINFLKKIYKENFNNFIFLLTIIIITTINIIINNFFGMIIRYIFEYLSLMLILSIIIFLFYMNENKDKLTKNLFNFLFILIFIFSVFINMALLFCRENFWCYPVLTFSHYTNVVDFLF